MDVDQIDHPDSYYWRVLPAALPALYGHVQFPMATGSGPYALPGGMYWERTATISNRHPADCVHAWLDFGPLAAGESRTLRGAVYFIEGSKDELLALWQRDFRDASQPG